jgi:serine/threonine protein kinase/tetratricopeptide (TPR) repeat protein
MVHDAARVKSIFLAAVERYPADQWSAFLDGACGEDAKLRERVERLLGAHDGQKSLHLPAPSQPGETVARPSVERPGEMVGPYKLMEQIGEGGMGVVYVAEQSAPVRRRVALKVIKPGMDSRQVVARFEAERQALALMDHPNIAKVHDGGTTPSGRPYFVMELVRGVPIIDYCDEQQLSIRERLELFVLVCRAVQHAHQKGVIHRDLKPSNILVTLHDGVPVPKVIDFGVAKATGQALTDKTVYTAFHQLVGTPLYMSPEQVELSGLDVDTRSDIYSLGVLLYELLTGTTPFDAETLRKAAFDEMRRIIREQEPQRPSTRLSSLGATLTTVSARRKADPRRLGPSLRGELDWVVMKALEKDRRRRYDTANDFATDVMRYLTDRPVHAHPPSAWYRFGKFARRNRPGLTTAVLVAAALVAGTAISLWQASKARAAAAEARLRADESQQVIDYLAKDVFGGAAPGKGRGRSMTLGELQDQADATVAERFRGQPLVEASARMALAQSYGYVMEWERAVRHAARAAELRARHLGPEHPATLQALNEQAWVLCRQSFSTLGNPENPAAEAGETIFHRVLAARRRVLGATHPDTLQTQAYLALTVGNLPGRQEEAEALAAQVEQSAARFLGPEHESTLLAREMLGIIAVNQGDTDRAQALLRKVLASRERTLGPLDDVTLRVLRSLAVSVRKGGRADEARQLYVETIDRNARVFGLPHINVSPTLNELREMLLAEGDDVAIRDLWQRWLRELLATPVEADPYLRERRVVRLTQFASGLAELPEGVPFDGELAVHAADEAVTLSDGKAAGVTRALLLDRAGRSDLALEALQKAKAQPDWAEREDDYCWLVEARVRARRGELAEARRLYEQARTRTNPTAFGQERYESLQSSVEALLAGSDPPARRPRKSPRAKAASP